MVPRHGGSCSTLFDDVFSPYAHKVRIALCEKDVPFERVRAPPLYPNAAEDRATCRLIEDLADTQLDAAL